MTAVAGIGTETALNMVGGTTAQLLPHTKTALGRMFALPSTSMALANGGRMSTSVMETTPTAHSMNSASSKINGATAMTTTGSTHATIP